MAQESNLPTGTVTALIDQLLKEKDPAAVGLRRILKSKQDQGSEFPCRPMSFTEFDRPEQGQKVFSDDERRILELERQVLELRTVQENSRAATEKAVRAAFEEGRKAGAAQGEQAGATRAQSASDKKLADLQSRTSGIVQALTDSRKRLFVDAEHLLTKLSCRIAQRIVRTELTQNPEVITATVKKALTFIADREQMIIRVNPSDYRILEDNRDFWLPVNERLKGVTVEQDERVAKGGCLVESQSGLVDARIDAQLAEVDTLIEKTWLSMSSADSEKGDPAPDA